MSARLRRLRRAVLPVHLGRTDLDELAATVRLLLASASEAIVLDVVGFDYFDEDALHALVAIGELAPDRVEVRGLDAYASALLPDKPAVIDARTAAERAVSHLASVTVVTAVVDGAVLDDAGWSEAITFALSARRQLVTIDLRSVAELSPGQLLTLAEASAELWRDLRTLLLVNATGTVAQQLKVAGLSGGLRLSVDELR